jgi:hypothetical protein
VEGGWRRVGKQKKNTTSITSPALLVQKHIQPSGRRLATRRQAKKKITLLALLVQKRTACAG